MQLTHGDRYAIIMRMPSKSPAQARLMAAAAHDPAFAERVGVPQSVAREFNQADKGKRLAEAMKAHAKRKIGLTKDEP